MTHSIEPLIVFEERAAKQMDNWLKLLSLFGKREGTERFQEVLWKFNFLDFTFVRFLEVPGRFSEGLLEANEKNKTNH